MKYQNHQVTKGEQLLVLLRSLGYAYLVGEVRSGKTPTAIYVAENSKAKSILILTKKKAIDGWKKFLNLSESRIMPNSSNIDIKITKKYHVTNYEQMGRFIGKKPMLKLNPQDYDLVIIDESHNFSAFPVINNRQKLLRLICKDTPHLHLSGTSYVESPSGIYHQMHLPKWSPFTEANFYQWFRNNGGIPYTIEVSGNQINQYDKIDFKVLKPKIDNFTIYMTQEDAGIKVKNKAEDILHYVELTQSTKDFYNDLQENQFAEIDGLDLICDTEMKLRTSLHMIESGVVKIDDDYIMLGNTEKIDYVKKTFGDEPLTGIMCHFIGERLLLEKHFKQAEIYSSSAHAEGVDLSHLENFVVFSSDYSGTKFIQRRDRITNSGGSKSTKVHFILTKGGISEQVYKTCSKKLNFNNSTYVKTRLQ